MDEEIKIPELMQLLSANTKKITEMAVSHAELLSTCDYVLKKLKNLEDKKAKTHETIWKIEGALEGPMKRAKILN